MRIKSSGFPNPFYCTFRIDHHLFVSYLCPMSPKEIYLKRLKAMQETARKIKPTPKSVINKISLTQQSAKNSKKEADCQF
jgi:hypothetical protein